MTRNSIIRKIQKFNSELQDCYNRIGENLLYCVDTTVIGDTTFVPLVEYTDCKTFLKVVTDNYTYRFKDGEDSFLLDMFLDDLKYYRRMIRKTLRIWESENPDVELEKDDEDLPF